MHRRTPCVGICSTTYGDLVCRGCKRFAHEIVQWNGFEESQRDQVRARLINLQVEVVRTHLEVVDADALAEQVALPATGANEPVEMLLLLYLRRHPEQALELAGVNNISMQLPNQASGADLVNVVDAEFLARSQAHYERNYKVSAV